jgi:hypothetical protein
MSLDSFKVLVGLQLSILRRAADMLVLHFGGIRVHPSGKGTVGTYALHAQCAWRFDGPGGTIAGRDDLWAYAGPGERPPNWSYEDGFSLQDRQFSKFFIRDKCTRSWVNPGDRFMVTGTEQTKDGDLRLDFTEGCQARQRGRNFGMIPTEDALTDNEHAIEHGLGLPELSLHSVEITQGEQRHRRQLMVFARDFLGFRN